MNPVARSRKSRSRKHASTEHVSTTDDSTKPTTEVEVSPGEQPVPSPAAAGPVTPAALLSFPAPPSLATIPTPPAGFIPSKTANFRGVVPYQEEFNALPAALQDLGKIPNYALFVGAPPLPYFTALLTLACQWTGMRNATALWDAYAQTQEGTLWTSARPRMEEFSAAFAQAQKADPTLATLLPGLTKFLGVRSSVAQKGVTTKRANQKSEAKGERPEAGQVGKQRKRAAEKAALAAADAQAAAAAAKAAAPQPPTPASDTTGNGAAHS